MTTKSPKLIETYVQVSNEIDANAYLSCFTENAIIMDDGESLTGHDAISKWFVETQTKYSSTTEPLRVTENADGIVRQRKSRVTLKAVL